MLRIVHFGRFIFGIAILILGLLHFIWARFGEAIVPVIPWVPGRPWLAYVFGVGLLGAGICIVSNRKAWQAAVLLGVIFLVFLLVRDVAAMVRAPMDLRIRTRGFEILAICSGAFMLAGTLPSPPLQRNRVFDLLIRYSRFLFAASAVIFGIDHFYVIPLIASLVPAWMPAHLFLAYFTGFAFIAAGVSIASGVIGRWGAFSLGTMFLLWFLLLHGPRVLSAAHAHDPNEWSSAFIALGMCGVSWICATALSTEQSPVAAVKRRYAASTSPGEISSA
jgi:uncharacterized membrane protein